MLLKVVISSVPSLTEGITSMEIADSAGTTDGETISPRAASPPTAPGWPSRSSPQTAIRIRHRAR